MLETYREDYVLKKTAEAESLAVMGRLTAGLAHEVRNPLNAATLQLDVLRRTAARVEDASMRRKIERRTNVVQDELRRLSLLLDDFLNLARARRLEPVRCEARPARGGHGASAPRDRITGDRVHRRHRPGDMRARRGARPPQASREQSDHECGRSGGRLSSVDRPDRQPRARRRQLGGHRHRQRSRGLTRCGSAGLRIVRHHQGRRHGARLGHREANRGPARGHGEADRASRGWHAGVCSGFRRASSRWSRTDSPTPSRGTGSCAG